MTVTAPLILIVDDNPVNIDLLVHTLQGSYRLGIAKDGPKALDYVARHRPDMVLLDVMMPGMNGFEVCERLKADPATADLPIIFITAVEAAEQKVRGFALGAVDYVTKPFLAEEVRARVQTHLALKAMREQLADQNAALAAEVARQTAALQDMLQATIAVMIQMAEIRDPYTAGHQQRVARLACAIARQMGLTDDQIRCIELAGILHDIGKIRIPTAVINRPGTLLASEHNMLKIHPQVGHDLLKTIPFPWPVADVVLQHHERLDGSGYPAGLTGDKIMLEARILAVADVTEAQSSFRPYRPALGIEAALAEIAAHSGTRYDPQVVEVCRRLFKEQGFGFA